MVIKRVLAGLPAHSLKSIDTPYNIARRSEAISSTLYLTFPTCHPTFPNILNDT